LPSLGAWALGQLGLVLLSGLYYGALPATLVEAAPPTVRCTAVALGYNLCLGLFGGLSPLVATWLVQRTGDENSARIPYYGGSRRDIRDTLQLSRNVPCPTRCCAAYHGREVAGRGQGQIAWGLGDAMWQEITVKDGRVVEGNFDAFQIARMADYPVEVNIAFLKSNNKWISGVGEEAIPQVAPAIAQAAFKITGKRIRSLPLANHDLRWG
jgi:hypothetical protein